MKKQRFLFAAAALSLGFSAIPAFAQSPSGDTPKASGGATKQNCAELKGAAREECLQKQTPRAPGGSQGDAKDSIPLDPTAAGGRPKEGGSSPASPAK